MPPFSAPVPEDEPPEPPKGRRPYSSPDDPPPAEPPRRPRRLANRPDKLVASGPPRPRPSGGADGPPERDRPTTPYRMPLPVPVPVAPAAEAPERPADATPVADQSGTGTSAGQSGTGTTGEEPGAGTSGDGAGAEPGGAEPGVRRVGRPPAGRPTRPDLLVASGPPRPAGAGGRHHRGPAPAALRRASPTRGRRSPAAPVAIVLALALVIAGGVLVWRWTDPGNPGLRLAAGTGRSGDDLFTVPSAGDGSNQKLNDMASAGRVVVAVGSDTTIPTPRPLFLFSPDSGRTWQLGQVTGATTSTVQRVVGGDGLWLASGGDGLGGELGLWTSGDGFSWSAVRQGGLTAFRNGDVIADIARTRSGFVAVGRTTLQDGSAGPAAWQSADGRSWQRVDTRELGARELKAVAARGDTVVAVAQPAQGEGSRAVRSADGGRTWQATGFQLLEATPRTGSLAAAGERFVLVPFRKRTPEGDVRVYCSPTGAEWSHCGSIRGLPGESPGVDSVVTHAGGIVAISQANLGTYTVLSSADGRTWTKRADLGDLSGATLRGFTVTEAGTLFAGGDRAAADVDNQLVLMSAPRGGDPSQVRLADVEGLSRIARQTTRLAAHDGRYVAVGTASGDAGIWTSLNWQNWTSMSLGGPHQQILDDVAHGRRGWLAVGGTQTAVGVTEPLLVSSADGRAWKPVAASGDLSRRQDHPYLDARLVAAGPKGYVLAGEERDQAGVARAALWFTSDLRRFTRSRKLPQGGSGVRVHDVAATPGGYVAVGGTSAGDEEGGVVWTSEDGLNWKARERVTPSDSSGAVLRQVVAHQDRIVAIGAARSQGSRRVFSAVSEDGGATWRTSWLPADRAAAVYDLAAAGQGLVAVGWHGTSGDGDSAAWLSRDGTTWDRTDLTEDRLAGPGMQWLAAVTVAGSEVVALGRSTTYSADHLILWTSTLSAGR
ncbi:hypothetical protein FHU36_001391 [Nonomuraea muscovyensis]|uniref:Exo-alpha-sialidase n=1 Tax=Nonomuraea muscovyensis TaxID=1124761 RepID=A0A7X0EUK8_9ACTN|nr:hypothetical protein [Nonomuraea muscovyensis]MBB6344882.1 hypothetical protein [Nonomuraea muscovyensis]